MRKLAILTFQSLDGVMQGPSSLDEDRSGDFVAGGWANAWWDPVMEDVREVAMAAPYDLLFGRKTYELFAPHWSADPTGSPEAIRMNEATKYVTTRGKLSPSWANTVVLSGDAATAVRNLKAGDGPMLQVHGSWDLIQTLHNEGLIDEYRIWTFPVIVGSGKRLFSDAKSTTKVYVVSQACLDCGVVRSVVSSAPVHGE